MVVGEGMSKQDRQGVRTPADIERKYNLGELENQNNQRSEKLTQLNQSFAQFEILVNAKLAELEKKLNNVYSVGSIYVNENDTDPSTLFGGTWELLGQGYFLAGLDTESEDTLAELQYLNNCYIWKRTA